MAPPKNGAPLQCGVCRAYHYATAGVITQKTSYELALNKYQKGILGWVQHLTLFFSILIAGPLVD